MPEVELALVEQARNLANIALKDGSFAQAEGALKIALDLVLAMSARQSELRAYCHPRPSVWAPPAPKKDPKLDLHTRRAR